MPEKNYKAFLTLAFIFLSAIFYLGNVLDRSQSLLLILSFFTAFFSYFWICRFENYRTKSLFGLGIIARILLLFSMPNLSDDIYRFIWDGRMLSQGLNPFQSIPADLVEKQFQGLDDTLFLLLNSPNYFTVYPPLNQVLFYLATYFSDSLLTTTNIIRLFIIGSEVGIYFLLRSFLGNKKDWVFWYFLNPIVIVEFTGSVHLESFVILFVLLSVRYLKKNQLIKSGISFAVAIGMKLLPVMFLPYIAWSHRWKKGTIFTLISLTAGVIFLLPMISEGVASSFDLYFRKFEFNASIYYVFREIGFWSKGYNTIATLGPRLSIISLILILFLTFIAQRLGMKFWTVLLFTLTIYLSFATTIHPWYIVPLIAYGLLSGFFYPIVWSGLVTLSYIGYGNEPYNLSVWFLFIEYLVVYGWMLFELKFKYEKNH